MATPTVIQTEHLEKEAVDWLAARCNLVACNSESDEFASHIGEAQGLVVRTYTQVDQALLDRAPNLKVVGRAGVALENIDIPACRARSIEVVHSPTANTQAVVEYATALILDALRPRSTVDRGFAVEEWKTLRDTYPMGRQLSEQVLGIYGLGRIGKRIAQVAGAIDARVIYCDLLDIEPALRHGAEPVDRETLLHESDVLTIHVDSRPSNRHLIDAAAMSLLKANVVFVNTSRGFVVDSAALAGFLQRNDAATAHLDVHDPEPFGDDYPLLAVENAHVYPHIAARTETALLNMSWVVKDVWAVIEGRSPEHPAPSLPVQ
ncbi:MAG: hypothetical protein KAS72_05740 [Phycisphaerales bacterium]|nr:hypothetical protein [Phycisphaerales bacterium]